MSRPVLSTDLPLPWAAFNDCSTGRSGMTDVRPVFFPYPPFGAPHHARAILALLVLRPAFPDFHQSFPSLCISAFDIPEAFFRRALSVFREVLYPLFCVFDPHRGASFPATGLQNGYIPRETLPPNGLVRRKLPCWAFLLPAPEGGSWTHKMTTTVL